MCCLSEWKTRTERNKSTGSPAKSPTYASSKTRTAKWNRSIHDVNGSVLSISQFTLYADVRKGNRPNFVKAGAPAHAEQTWHGFNDALRSQGLEVKEGRFGSHMRVRLANDGPVTIILDTDELGV